MKIIHKGFRDGRLVIIEEKNNDIEGRDITCYEISNDYPMKAYWDADAENIELEKEEI